MLISDITPFLEYLIKFTVDKRELELLTCKTLTLAPQEHYSNNG